MVSLYSGVIRRRELTRDVVVFLSFQFFMFFSKTPVGDLSSAGKSVKMIQFPSILPKECWYITLSCESSKIKLR